MNPHDPAAREVYVALAFADALATEPRSIKIGIARDARSRVRGLRHGNHNRPVRLVASFRGTECDEHFLHGVFAADHIQHEWFRLSPELLAFADRLAAEGAPLVARMRSAALSAASTAARTERTAA